MPTQTLASNSGEVPKAEGVRLKQKLARARGENSIHAVPPDLYRGISLEPLTEPSVQLTGTDGRLPILRSVLRSRVVFGDIPWKRLSIFDLFSLSGSGPRTRPGRHVSMLVYLFSCL